MHKQETLTGIIDRFLFQNDQNGFSILVLKTKEKQPTIVKGYLPALTPGQEIEIQGSWIFHKKFGKQFEATSYNAILPTSIVGLKKYLGSGLIKGIGKVYAEKMVNHFGIQTLDIIDKEPVRLTEVNGIGPRRVEQIIHAWKDQKEISSIMVFLQEKDISPAYATKIYKKYGQESIAVLHENPYRIADEIWGIGFKIADQIAQKIGIANNSPKRIVAGILYAISQHVGNGNLYIELEALKQSVATLLEIEAQSDAQKITTALHDLYNQEKIKLISDDNGHFLTLSSYYFSELGVAHKIKKLLERPTEFAFDINAIYQELRIAKDEQINLNEDQQHGILSCLQNKVSIITGGPGTGKTTLIKQLLTILDEKKYSYKLAAPTGRAAKRITEGTGRYALTIHRLLEFNFSTMSFTHNEQNALKLDFLIIDEASMIDIFLAYALLKALPWQAHLVLIGDIHQLPSVGAGNFLHDLIASNQVPFVALKHIFRQAQNSLIIVNAHRINNGEFPTSHAENSKKDFIFIKEDAPENVAHHLTTIFKRVLPHCAIRADEAIVLVPMNRGIAGTQNLNQVLQTMLNGTTTGDTLTRMGTTYKCGDQVMQIRNNYDKRVFNGDIGIIKQIDKEDSKLQVNYDDRIVEYDTDELNELVLSYAITIHKSQGSEYPAVIVPLFMQHFALLQRNLIYTAITRAKKLCIFIGQSRAIAIGIKNNKNIKRKTFLKEFLTTDLVCR